jgi:hypothetical protein
MERIGIALTADRNGRKYEYGILRGEHGGLYVQYEGYQEGNWRTGLPLAGPGAAHLQSLVDFIPADFEVVRFFS